MSGERIAIVGYRPLPGKEADLEKLMKTHVQILRDEGLATERPSIVMRAEDGTLIEVFGWKSKDAIAAAHQNPVVGKMWQEYAAVCEYVPIGSVREAGDLFSEFSVLF